jgi:hypothetical protein
MMFQAILYERGEHIDSTDSGISCLGDLTHHQSPLTQAESVEYAVCHGYVKVSLSKMGQEP